MNSGRAFSENDVFVRASVGSLTGYVRSSFNLSEHWNAIEAAVAHGSPCYAMKEWRRVFRIPLGPSLIAYVKDVDETRHEKRRWLQRFSSTEGLRYFRNYQWVRRIGITTPELLFVLHERRRFNWVRSITATAELVGYQAWPEFFASREGDEGFAALKEEVLSGLACLVGQLHRSGTYSSLDGRNILVRQHRTDGEGNIALIDLDHVRSSRFGTVLRRRRRRNLGRLQRTIERTPGLSGDDYRSFLDAYNNTWRKAPAKHAL